MSIHCSLLHKTSYHYDRPVRLSPQVIRLRPAPHSRTEIPAYSLKITPANHFLNWQQDTQGNFLARLVFPEPVRSLEIEVNLIADLSPINPFDFFVDESAEEYPFTYSKDLKNELAPFLVTDTDDARGELLEKFQAGLKLTPEMGINDFMVVVNQAVSEVVGYTIRMEPGVQSPEETLQIGTGSCRDSAWLMVNTMRRLGVAARFCSGYLIQLKADQKPVDGGAEGPAEDFTDLHAWTEIYLPGAGWVGLDPTSGLLAGEGHIPLCSTAHYRDAAPLTGGLMESEKVECKFEFEMEVQRIHETPRVTKPYTEAQEKEIEKLGHFIDRKLKAQDVRLTMGGEPTFVSASEMESNEWNIDALGPTKKGYGETLLRRLHERFSPGGFLHHGQGKWYPGEPLPRWAFTSYWREDGQPVWTDPELFGRPGKDYGHTAETSQAFSKLLAKNIGVSDDFIRTAHEDIYYYLWKERRLPINVSVDDSRLATKLERETLSKVFEQGVGAPVGHILPLFHEPDANDWLTGPWLMASEQIFLHPGNHPMGYRLPLDSLPWAKHDDQPNLEEADPSIRRAPLDGERLLPPSMRKQASPIRMQNAYGDAQGLSSEEVLERQRKAALQVPEKGESAKDQVRTALCVEAREGLLHVFFPPVPDTEAYLELVAAVEETARELKTPILIEGYKPPHDPRINSFSVTPDPGVLEINIHPSKNWDQIVERTRVLYDEARKCGLGTEKFMQDGRHSGTGGGNHIVVGGETPLDSPFLRRPDLLQSVITYFNNHPSLSYLFSGLFIGPTSQAPRFDEARHEAAYELETAFSALPKTDTTLESCQWLIDRILRNHLVDLTGNTHRSEICIDKLFGPGPTGRLGLVEFRGFEMPPHPEMSLSQQLLIRGLIARFWDQPYEQKLIRWGSSLHDKWMLPHYLKDDLDEIIDDLTQHGLHFQKEWYEPHLEFRFPMLGEHTERNVHMEFRQAGEPWNVLGEESSSSGTSRYVDSSVERVQVKVSNLTDSRHLITCNGIPLPLAPTGRKGEFVAGVRYRAWSPFSAMHPTLPINSPLTFDLVDRWNETSLGACQYHVVHPGGRSYDDFPLNAMVAESRRRSRFFHMGKTGGKINPSIPQPNPDYPLTLDLQRFL